MNSEYYSQPMFFERNRVFRVYTGGALFADFFGDERQDGFYPEEWIASDVRALNEGHDDIHEGISKIEGTDVFLDEALNEHKREILGEKNCIGVLTKVLDSAIRLPVQAHPSRAFAAKNFGSRFGKQEAWLILGKRDGAKIYYGFRDGVSMTDFLEAIEKSENGGDEMEKLLCSHEVNIGDVIFIPAGMVHAIGKGCLLLEAQEPTDFTIQPERFCGDYKLSDNEMYLGLHKEVALGCFNMELKYDFPLTPKVIADNGSVKYETLIGKEQTDCFAMRRITLNQGSFTLAQTAGVYVVIDGEGVVLGEEYERKVKKGDYFLLPANAAGRFTIETESLLTMVEAFGR